MTDVTTETWQDINSALHNYCCCEPCGNTDPQERIKNIPSAISKQFLPVGNPFIILLEGARLPAHRTEMPPHWWFWALSTPFLSLIRLFYLPLLALLGAHNMSQSIHQNIVAVSPFPTASREQKELECPIWRRSQEIKVTRQRHHPSPVCDVPNLVRQSGTSIGGYQKHSKQQIRAGVSPGGAVRSRIRWGQEAGLELQHRSERYNQKTGC